MFYHAACVNPIICDAVPCGACQGGASRDHWGNPHTCCACVATSPFPCICTRMCEQVGGCAICSRHAACGQYMCDVASSGRRRRECEQAHDSHAGETPRLRQRTLEVPQFFHAVHFQQKRQCKMFLRFRCNHPRHKQLWTCFYTSWQRGRYKCMPLRTPN